MNAGGYAIGLSGGGIGHVANGLHVRHTVEKDIILRLQPAIGHAAEGIGERQRFRCQIEFQDIITRWGWRRWFDRVGERRPVRRPAVWAKYQIEAGSSKGSSKVRQYTQRNYWGVGGPLRLLLEPTILRMDLELGWKTYGCGGGFGGGSSYGKGNLSGHS